MILINVHCIEMDQVYDFRVDETAPVSRLVEDMVEVIGKYARLSVGENTAAEFVLCDGQRNRILAGDTTLAISQVKAGDMLILV